jgi:hypothetical protein
MFRRFLEDQGIHHPAYLKKPPPRPDCIKYLDAFRILGGFSFSGPEGSPTRITLTEVNAYAEGTNTFRCGPPRAKLFRIIRLMEDHWASLESKR